MHDHQRIKNYQASNNLLAEKIILVTGAGAGIGKSAAISFAKHGATVVLTGRTLSKLEAVYDEIEAHDCPRPAIFPINFESAIEQDYQALFEALENEFGRLDGVLHNAAELGQRTPIENYAIATWQKVMQVNVNAPFMLTKALIPLLKKSSSSSVIFTSSKLASHGQAFWGAYSVSKAAIENLMQVFADETENVSTLRVNAIDPGATRTEMRAAAYPAEDPETVKSPSELMACYLYLMGEDSADVHKMIFRGF